MGVFTTELKEFFNNILPQNNLVYAFGVKKKYEDNRWLIKTCNSIDDIIKLTEKYMDAGDLYYSPGEFKRGWYTSATNKRTFKTQDNVNALKSIWLDVDCGKSGTPYKDYIEGLKALNNFIGNTGLPEPTIVLSGLGLHLYWTFDQSIDKESWKTLTYKFQKILAPNGLIVDAHRTMDCASFLRIPFTKNNGKDGVIRDVKILLSGNSSDIADIENLVNIAFNKLNISLPAKVESQIGNYDPDLIINKCRQIREAPHQSYPTWFNMITVLGLTNGGFNIVNSLSSKGVKYDELVVREKYEEVINSNLHPCSCEKFNILRDNVCDSCEYYNRINSPIVLGRIQKNGESIKYNSNKVVTNRGRTLIPYEDYFYIVKRGMGIYKKVYDSNGVELNPRLLSEVELYIHSKLVDRVTSEQKVSYIITVMHKNDTPVDIVLPRADTSTSNGFITWMNNNMVLPISSRYNKDMEQFMSSYIASVQRTLPDIQVYPYFGWDKDNRGFIIGDTLYKDGKEQLIKLTDRASRLGQALQPKGSLEEWKKIANMYKELDQPIAQLMILSAIGSSLMCYGADTATNIIYHLWDIEGGKGKSNVLRVICSVYGNPSEMLLTRNDTNAARFQYFSVYKNISVVMDEMSTINGTTLMGLIYDMVNGYERKRSTSTGTTLTDSGSWQTTFAMTSNKSFYETFRATSGQTEALHMRVIEYMCDFKSYAGTEKGEYISNTLALLNNNYGLAGIEFIKYITSNLHLIDDLSLYTKDFKRRFKTKTAERFWVTGITTALFAGKIAKLLGIVDYDMDHLESWCGEVLLKNLRSNTNTNKASALDIVNDYIGEHTGETLTVLSANRPKDSLDTKTKDINDKYVKTYPMYSLNIRYEIENNTYYIRCQPFCRWARERGLSPDNIISGLQNDSNVKLVEKKEYNLSVGVGVYGRGRSQVYKIVLSNDE